MTATPNPARVDLRVLQGTDWIYPIKVQDAAGALRDLSTATAEMQVRATRESATSLLTLSTGNGMISVGTFGTGSGQYNLELTIPKASTTALTNWGDGYYDLELTIGTTTIRLMEGNAVLSREITR